MNAEQLKAKRLRQNIIDFAPLREWATGRIAILHTQLETAAPEDVRALQGSIAAMREVQRLQTWVENTDTI